MLAIPNNKLVALRSQRTRATILRHSQHDLRSHRHLSGGFARARMARVMPDPVQELDNRYRCYNSDVERSRVSSSELVKLEQQQHPPRKVDTQRQPSKRHLRATDPCHKSRCMSSEVNSDRRTVSINNNRQVLHANRVLAPRWVLVTIR